MIQTTERIHTQKLCGKSLEICPFSENVEDLENGHEFNKYFFAKYPHLRAYNGTLEDVEHTERFRRQSVRFLFSVHVCVKIFDNESLFRNYIRETVNRHRQFRLRPELWTAFWTAWQEFLEHKASQAFDENTRLAWTELGAEFANVALEYSSQIH